MIIFLSILYSISNPAYASDFTWLESVKKNCRQDIMGARSSSVPNPRLPIYSPILDGDRAEDLVEFPSRLIRNIQVMERNKLMKKQVSVEPWSDTYWPLYLGAIAQRYGDQNFVGLDWKAAKNYIAENSVLELIQKKQMDVLAPSEKYDYLMGLTQHTLTASNWAEGEQYYREYGSVESWMGLCHGWSAAAIMMENPLHKVEVKTQAGEMVFFPSDIKALGTLLWAKGGVSSRFIGGRCNSKKPPNDSMGRSKEEDCLDNNPGTWHMAIVNQIGQFNRSFVMDATYDYQVWNQPVFGYQYSYYNPKTGKASSVFSDAITKKSAWATDPRKTVRALEAESIVGVKMNVTYVIESSPDQEENQPSNFTQVEYVYDLELNNKLEIIGGEWYSDNHPDFLWVPDQKTFPETYGDHGSAVDLNHLSSEVRKAALINAARDLPSGAVVRELFKNSAKN